MIRAYNHYYIFCTFFIALILTLLPMPGWAIYLRPAWILIVLIYWSMMAPEKINIGFAWFIGLFLDILEGTLLGEHAFAFTVVTYLVVKMHTRLRMFPLVQQGLSIFILVLLYQFILFCIQGFIGVLPTHWLYWSSSLTSMLLWPWIYSILHGHHDEHIV